MPAPSTNHRSPPIAGRLPAADPAPAAADQPAGDPVQDLAEAVARRLLAAGPGADPDPLLVGHAEAARLVGVSTPTWHRHVAAGKIGPTPVKLGGRVLWNVAELRDWTARRGPDRQLLTREQWLAVQRPPGPLPGTRNESGRRDLR